MVQLHDFDVPIRAKPAGDLFDNSQQQVDAQAHIGRPYDRNFAPRLPHRGTFLGREARGTDYYRLSQSGDLCGVSGGRGGCREFNHDVAVADQLFGIIADRDTEPPDSGEFADVLTYIAAAWPGAATGQRT